MSDDASPGSPSTDTAAAASMRRDVLSAYAATGSKILSWVIVLGLVYRLLGPIDFALASLIRGTIGILNYTTLGLSPAMVRLLAEARAKLPADARAAADPGLTYGLGDRDVRALYSNGMMIALICGALGAAVTFAYAWFFGPLFDAPFGVVHDAAGVVAVGLGLGTVIRLMSDAPGAVLQSHGQIAFDNMLVASGEAVWVVCCVAFFAVAGTNGSVHMVAIAYALSGVAVLANRAIYAARLTGLSAPSWRLVDETTIRRLLGYGSLVLFAQLADYLYAPCDYILISRLIGWDAVEAYTPAMTIDSGLLLLVTGLSSVILPRTALAHAAGEMERVRRYYLWGTTFSAFLLIVAAVAVWALSPILFRLWLGSSMPATQAILPLVLIHTVVGGSSAVGRSILLGMGRVKAFTISVLLAGVTNVVLSYIFVRHLNLGLKGIVLGTIVVVVLRAGVWMPWYVLRTLRREIR